MILASTYRPNLFFYSLLSILFGAWCKFFGTFGALLAHPGKKAVFGAAPEVPIPRLCHKIAKSGIEFGNPEGGGAVAVWFLGKILEPSRQNAYRR